MRSRTLIIGYVLVFVMLLGVGFNAIQTVQAIEATVRITPKMVSLEDPTTGDFRVTIKLPAPYTSEDIDPDTILVEGVISMKEIPDYPQVKKKFFAFKVDSTELIDGIILPKIWHMAPPPGTKVYIPITVTGELHDGTPFQGTFDIQVKTEIASPPPPHP